MHKLDHLLKPRSVAFFGASAKPDSPGNAMLKIARSGGYAGEIFAINPKYKDVDGTPCFPDLDSLPTQVDHVVLGVANELLEPALANVIRYGARAVTIFATCESSDGVRGEIASRLTAIAREADVAICGGNSMGFINPGIGLSICGFPSIVPHKPGGVAFITQSGSAFSALAYNDQRLKFSLCMSSGRELTTTAADYVDWSLDQPETKVVGLFLETAREPLTFERALHKADRLNIPVVVLKVGRTELAARFAASHSGAIVGNSAAYEALFRSYGVTSVDTLDQLAAAMLMFSTVSPPPQGGLASLHDSGGEREMVVDLASRHGVRWAEISAKTKEKISSHLDSGLEAANPLDAWGSGRDFEMHVEACMDAMLEDPDTAIGVLFQDVRHGSYIAEGFTRAVIRSAEKTHKPVAVISNYSAVNHRQLALQITEAGVPVIDGTEEGLFAIRALFKFRDRRRMFRTMPEPVGDPIRQRWRVRLAQARQLSEQEALTLLSDYGIRVPRILAANSKDAVIAAARSLGYPIVLKTAAEGIHHKSDVGGVHVGLSNEENLVTAYSEMASRLGPDAVVCEMAPQGVEVAFGLIHDREFGPYLLVASGGLWIEVMKDRVVALAPLSIEQSAAMIAELKVEPLLNGARGAAPADKTALHEALARFSLLVGDLGDLMQEMDVNPLLVSDQGCIAVDALVMARSAAQNVAARASGAHA